MKQRILYLLLIATVALSVIYFPVQAQDATPYVIRSTQPISAELRSDLDAYLAVSPPSNAHYYIVTHVRLLGSDTIVSMAGVDLSSPDADWNFEDGIAVWLGSVSVASNGNVSPLTPEQASASNKVLFAPAKVPLFSLQTVEDSNGSVTYVGAWGSTSGHGAHNNDFHYSNQTGAYLNYTFTGTAFSIYALTDNNRGMCKVYDGATLIATYDEYSATETAQVLIYSGVWAYGTHTLGVQVAGTKNSSSSDYYCSFDYLTYEDATPTPTSAPTDTFTPTATFTPTNTFTPTATSTPTNTATFTPSATPSNTPVASATPTVTLTPSNTPPPPPPTVSPPPGGGGAGGSASLLFPFRNNAQYGPKGVHNAGYGTSGLVAVDLVGGDDMGVGIMPPNVYSSDGGTIDYVCTDAIQTAVRTHNSSTGDYFIYAHMKTNSSLEVGHSFSQGEMMGSLKYGTFDDTCGYASQNATQYHVHWAFHPASGKFQVGSCVLTVSTQTWLCGNTVVKIGQFLQAGGGYVAGGEGGSGTSGAGGTVVSDPTFWDYILNGFLSIVDNGILKLLPEHNPFQYTYMLFNVIEIVLRLAWVLAASNINLGPLATVLILSIGIRAAFSIIWFIAFLFKAWKSLVPVLGA